jgi:hypothetical protein
VADLSELAGLQLDPWQIWVMEQACAQREETFWNPILDQHQRKWAAFEVALVVSRQNGKGSLLEARELAGLFLFGERLIIHSAHQFATSKEAFERILQLLEGCPDLEKEIKSTPRSHGEEGIILKNGQRLKFFTRTKVGGRGFTGDCLILDEAMILNSGQVGALMPVLSARPNSQIWYTGSAGDKESTQLGSVRQRGLKGGDRAKRLFYCEWSIDACTDFCIPGCTDHDKPDTLESWAKANPALGIRISAEHVQAEFHSMDDETFARERLGVGTWPVEGDQWSVISEDAWMARADELSDIVDDEHLVLAVDTTPDRKFSCIAAAGKNDEGEIHVEITSTEDRYDHRPGTQWVVPRVKEICRNNKIAAVVIDKGQQASGFIGPLEDAGITVLSPITREYAEACGSFVSSIVPRKGNDPDVVHKGQPPLNAALAGADTRVVSDMWAWDKRSSTVDISPLVSATIAIWGHRKMVLEKPKSAEPWIVRR